VSPQPPPGSAPTAVIVLAAGAGTRMRSATPKVLHGLGGRTLLAHALHAATSTGAHHVVVVLGHARTLVAAEVESSAAALGVRLTVAVQVEQRGTGDAVAAGLAALPADAVGTVLVTSGDVPLLGAATLAGLHAEHVARGSGVTVLTTVLTDPTGYGRVLRSPDGSVDAIVEHADADAQQRAVPEVNSGVYAFDLDVLRVALGQLDTDNAQGELYLPDVLGLARRAGHGVGALAVADSWLVAGVNDRVQLAELGAELNRRVLERWMRAGVTVVDPATTWVDVDVELAPDVELLPGVQLHGRTTVATGARVGPDTTLTDVRVGAGAVVVRTHGAQAVVGQGAVVGPFAYLRPGTDLAADVKIGTFVETKNARIGAGSKVPHLTYVGDATIGEHSNIGASSVFVNYDGVRKNRTEIGSHVRTGSDTMFIAPVRIGDGAYTGAGTVVRHDVPPGALAVSGGAQRTIEGWVAAKRPGTPAAEAAAAAQESARPDLPDPADDEKNGDAL
jgi:bifunctional UDP-N-acetylglucosamine pyrophosphorylase/glucosamine-1-phosphate N-acetyltransferase